MTIQLKEKVKDKYKENNPIQYSKFDTKTSLTI